MRHAPPATPAAPSTTVSSTPAAVDPVTDDGPRTLDELESAAAARLATPLYDFVAGGALAERTLRANREAFDRVRLVARVLRARREPDTTTTLLGARLAMPVYVAPMSAHGLLHPRAEAATAEGAARAGAMFVAPTMSNRTLEEIAGVAPLGPRWFQLYPRADAGVTRELVRRAESAGYGAIVLTVDQPVNGRRERDRRHGFRFPADLAFANLPARLHAASVDDAVSGALPFLDWDEVDRIRAWTTLPVVLKGVQCAADAAEALRRDVPGLIVSNHGGRQLDGGWSALDALREVAPVVQGRTLLLVDGGVRRGTDVAAALALGAHAVGVGRPALWALALGGADGVAAMLHTLHAELVNALALMGVERPRELTPDWVR